MCNNHYPDSAITAIQMLTDALIDVECTAALAEKHGDADYKKFMAGCIRLIATRSLDKAKAILIADIQEVGHA